MMVTLVNKCKCYLYVDQDREPIFILKDETEETKLFLNAERTCEIPFLRL